MADPNTPTRQIALNLDTLIDRKTVVIDAREYTLRPIDDLPFFEYRRMRRYGERLDALLKLDADPTEAEEAEFTQLLDQLMAFMFEELPPPDVLARLGMRKRMAIWSVFQTLSPSSHPSAGSTPAAVEDPAAAPSTTSSSSPDLLGSIPAPLPVTG